MTEVQLNNDIEQNKPCTAWQKSNWTMI